MGTDGKLPLWDLNGQNINTNLSLYIKETKHIPLHTGSKEQKNYWQRWRKNTIHNINLLQIGYRARTEYQ